MKLKIKFLLFPAAAIFLLSSCEKEFTCECTTTGGSSSLTTSSEITAKRKDAKAWCDSHESTFGGISTTCKLK